MVRRLFFILRGDIGGAIRRSTKPGVALLVCEEVTPYYGSMPKSPSMDKSPGQRMAISSPPAKTYFAHRPWLLALILGIVTFTAYFPSLRGGFVFDDLGLIKNNRLVHASEGPQRFWFTTEATDYYPLTWSLWWLEWHMWGANPLGYRVVNLILHVANALLVWIVLRRLRVPGAWLAALVFAVHPVNVATGAWISEQKNTLSMFFFSLAILLYLRLDETSRCRWYGLSLAAFLLALLSKSAVVMLPVVLLGCVWWTRGRVVRKDVLRSVPYFALSLVFGLVTMWYQYHLASGEPVVGTDGVAFRLAAAGYAPWFYLGKATLPVNLMAVYPKWQLDASSWIAYLPGAALLACFLLFWWKRRTWGRPLLFGPGYFVVMLFPVLGLLKQGPNRLTFMSDHWDHWQYYSIIGVIALVVAAGERTYRRAGEPGRSVGVVASLAVLIVLGLGTWRRSSVWANDEALWIDNVAKNPNSWVAHDNLGNALCQMGRVPEAIGQYERALWIVPDNAKVHFNLGVALGHAGQLRGAIGHYEQALRSNPDFTEAHVNLGIALSQIGSNQAGLAQFKEALRLSPDSPEVHCNLGMALFHAGRVTEAAERFEQALRIEPDYIDAHFDFGLALEKLGRTAEAIEQYQQALKFRPDFAAARSALTRLGSGP